MQRSEVDQWYIGCDGNLEIVKGIVRYRLSNKISRGRIKERIVCVENALKSRTINVPGLTNILDLAIPECSVVAPASVKELVSFYSDGAQPGFVFVIKQSVAKIGNPRLRAARDELPKRVKWVKSTRRGANFRSTRSIRRLGSSRDGSMRRDKDRELAGELEGAGSARCQLIMRLYVGIIEVTVKLELIVADLIVKRDIAAPAFLFRKGTPERVDVKAG